MMQPFSLLLGVLVFAQGVFAASAALSAGSSEASSGTVQYIKAPAAGSTAGTSRASCMITTNDVSPTTIYTSTDTCKPKTTVAVTTNITITVTAQSTSNAGVRTATELACSCVPTVTEVVTIGSFATFEASAAVDTSSTSRSTPTLTSTIYSTDSTITVIELSSSLANAISPGSGSSYLSTTTKMSISSLSTLGSIPESTSFPTNFWSNAASTSVFASTSPFGQPNSITSASSPSAKSTTTVHVWASTETIVVVRINDTSTTFLSETSSSKVNMTSTSSVYTDSSISPLSPTSGTTIQIPSIATSTSTIFASTSTTTQPPVSVCYDSNMNAPTPCTHSSNSLETGPTYSGAITITLGNAGSVLYAVGWLGYLATALFAQAAFFFF